MRLKSISSCDLLVALVTPKFNESKWTEQEVGWVLGKGTPCLCVKYDSANLYGFMEELESFDLNKEEFSALIDEVGELLNLVQQQA